MTIKNRLAKLEEKQAWQAGQQQRVFIHAYPIEHPETQKQLSQFIAERGGEPDMCIEIIGVDTDK